VTQSYEIEIKSLLGSREAAEILVEKMRASGVNFLEFGSHKQLNHYFTTGNTALLHSNTVKYLPEGQKIQFKSICDNATEFSLRTRQADKDVMLVIKASVDDTTSSNGTARMEFEAKTPDLSLDQLDNLVLKSGFGYQAKWSRERREFKYKGLNVTIDKNAGYGYLAEFEAQITDPNMIDTTKAMIRGVMDELGTPELTQERLERMFAFYNANWEDYYGTEKTFTID